MLEEDGSEPLPSSEGGQPSYWRNLCPWMFTPTAKALLQGQFISILIAGTGVFATILSDSNANFPLLMNLFNYLLLSLFLFRKMLRDRATARHNNDFFSLAATSEDPLDSPRGQEKGNVTPERIRINRWLYFLGAILDVEANFLVLEAYNYTNVTSIMLLDCFTIPCVMALSYFLLGCRYKVRHGFGVTLCVVGLVCIVVNDVLQGDSASENHALIGDLLCIGGCIFYASSNVLEETMVKYVDRDEYLGYVGSFGVGIAFVQCMIVDLHHMQQAHFTPTVILSMAGFILCLFFMYTNTTAFLQESDATLFNLGLLTSDVYAVIFTYFFDGYLVSWLYFLAFFFVLCGLLLYHSEKPPLLLGQEEAAIKIDSTMLPPFLRACVVRTPNAHGNNTDLSDQKTVVETYLSPIFSGGNSVMRTSSAGVPETQTRLSARHMRSNKLHFQYNPVVEGEDDSSSDFTPSPSSHARS